VRHLVVVGDAQDGAGFILIPLRLTRSAYQQVVGLSKVFFGETALAAGFIDEMDLPEAVLSRAEDPEELAASPSVREIFVSRIKRCTDAGLLTGDPVDIAHVLLALAQGLAVQEGGRWLGKSKASVNRRWEVGVTGILRGFAR
jgi:enoyl-CoA hydratase/carnithine racemase